MAAQNGQYADDNGMQYKSIDHRARRQRNDNRDREFRNEDRGRGDYDTRDRARDYGYAYTPAPVYQSAPVYGGRVYENGYHSDRTHNGRAAAEHQHRY